MPEASNQKAKNIIYWLSIFYNKLLFQHVDFEQIFDDISLYHNEKNKDPSAKNKAVLNGTNSVGGNLLEKAVTNLKEMNQTNTQADLASIHSRIQELHFPAANPIYQQTLSNLNNSSTASNLHPFSFQQLNIPQISLLSDAKLSASKDDNEIFSLEPHNSIGLSKTIKDITFVSLLLAVIFYKLRYVFPSLVAKIEGSWKFLVTFERELQSSFLHDTFSEFLQTELFQQRQANKKRTDQLKQEVLFLEKMMKQVDKEVESEIYRLVQMQNKSDKIPLLLPLSRDNQQSTSNSNILSQSIATNKLLSNSAGLKTIRPCPECGKIFRNTYKLNRHLYVHKDPSEKPFMCNWENCNYRSISKNDLNRHRMIHTGEKPYLCEIEGCEKRYSRADKLRHHKLSVHFKDSNKKEQICIWPGCNFQCLSRNELNRHQLSHEAKCDFIGCDKIFDKVDKLKKHREKDHVKIEVTLAEYPAVNFSSVPISVTSTPDIATVAASSNHHSSLQMQHVMLSNNNINSIDPLHHDINDDNNKMSDMPSHISMANVTSEDQMNVANDVINTTSSVPIPSSSNHRQNTISVWSS